MEELVSGIIIFVATAAFFTRIAYRPIMHTIKYRCKSCKARYKLDECLKSEWHQREDVFGSTDATKIQYYNSYYCPTCRGVLLYEEKKPEW